MFTYKAELMKEVGLADKQESFRRLLREFEAERGYKTGKSKMITRSYADAFIDWVKNLHKKR